MEKAPTTSNIEERFLANIIDQIFSHAREEIMQTLESAEDLPMAIGQVSAELMKSQLDAMNAVGKQLSQDVYLDAGAEIVKNLTEMASAMGLIDSGQNIEQLQSEALNNATQIFGQIGSEYIDAPAAQQFVVEAASGKFDNMGADDGQTG